MFHVKHSLYLLFMYVPRGTLQKLAVS